MNWVYRTYEELKPISILFHARHHLGVYRTYEELKHFSSRRKLRLLLQGLSYLWGIETLHPLTLLCFQFSGFIVPMRNWNTVMVISQWCTWHRVYRTYEELKHGISWLFISPLMRVYRTYEELKPISNMRIRSAWSWVYRTYEELKLLDGIEIFNGSTGGLSYLWGIETPHWPPLFPRCLKRVYRTYEELKLVRISWQTVRPRGFIVPMRNWNFLRPLYYSSFRPGFIVPMRNWNIDSANLSTRSLSRVYRTYEELKLS